MTCFIENASSDSLIKVFFTLCLHFTNWLVESELKHCPLGLCSLFNLEQAFE